MPPANIARRSIGLLGGSFNPPHEGHREISLAAMQRLGLDAVWWLVTPGNPLKDHTEYAPLDERLRLARKKADHPHIIVSDFERRQNLQFTVDTIERLQLLNPNMSFVWIMGADSLANFHDWKDWRRIADQIPLAVFNRPGVGDRALTGRAATELALFRLAPNEASKLAETEPPAWVYFADLENPSSSTAIRKAQQDSNGAT